MLPCYEYFFGNFIFALIARTFSGNRLNSDKNNMSFQKKPEKARKTKNNNNKTKTFKPLDLHLHLLSLLSKVSLSRKIVAKYKPGCHPFITFFVNFSKTNCYPYLPFSVAVRMSLRHTLTQVQ